MLVTAAKKELMLTRAGNSNLSLSPNRASTPGSRLRQVVNVSDESEEEESECQSPQEADISEDPWLNDSDSDYFDEPVPRSTQPPQRVRTAPLRQRHGAPKKTQKAHKNEQKRIDALGRKLGFPNIHTILYVPQTVREYASPRNTITWGGEDKHK